MKGDIQFNENAEVNEEWLEWEFFWICHPFYKGLPRTTEIPEQTK